MLTYAAIRPANTIANELWHTDGKSYVHLGNIFKGPIMDGSWVLIIKCGAAIRKVAEHHAKQYEGGRVVEVHSDQWPDHSDVEAAIRSAGLIAGKAELLASPLCN